MRTNGRVASPPTRESVAEWFRAHSAVVGAVAIVAVAAVCIFSLVVAEGRLRDLNGNEGDRASSATSSTSDANATTARIPDGPSAPPGLASDLFDATNTDRTNASLKSLRWNADLAASAQLWANTMADGATLGYQDLSGILDLGFESAAENVLVGPADLQAAAAEASWMNSATHRASIVNAAYTDVGVGVATSVDGRVWITVTFAG